jgi:RNA polymerase primary sigma factor
MRQMKISKSITNRESPSLEKYLQEIGKVPLIAPEEEVELCKRIKKGDKIALERLVKGNLRFVVSVAKQYQGHGLSLPDLINEGNMGLIKAAEKFDDTRGFRFISFGVWWIRQNMLQAIAMHARMVRIPLNKVSLKNRIQKTHSQLEQELGRAPSAEELAEAMGMDLDDISASLTSGHQHISLDVPLGEEEDTSLLDTIANPNASETDSKVAYSESLREELNRAFQQLSERQRETICYFFGIGVDYPMSLDDIARKFSLTPERVRQIKDKALTKLRSNKNFETLRTYLAA